MEMLTEQLELLVTLLDRECNQFAHSMTNRLTDVFGVDLTSAVKLAEKYVITDRTRLDIGMTLRSRRGEGEKMWGWQPETTTVEGIRVVVAKKAEEVVS